MFLFIINHVNPGLHSIHRIFLCRITVDWEESSLQQYRVCEMEKLIFKIAENRGILNDSHLLWGWMIKVFDLQAKNMKVNISTHGLLHRLDYNLHYKNFFLGLWYVMFLENGWVMPTFEGLSALKWKSALWKVWDERCFKELENQNPEQPKQK